MKHLSKQLLAATISALACSSLTHASVDSITEALTQGKAYGDIRLRYESVEQDNDLDDASALTVRTRLGYNTEEYKGLSATIEFEDSRKAGISDYNSTQNGKTEYSIIADPEATELDQAYLQYKVGELTAKVGSQVITYDNHRFVGHVGWRQDRQTFDALSLKYTPMDNLTLDYAYIGERNKILAEAADQESKDHLFNVGFGTDFGKLSAYAYLLEREDLAVDNALDTYGLRFSGSSELESLKVLYAAEYATQTSEAADTEFDADYMMLEAGLGFELLTVKLAYENLGSDNGDYGFSTPLATLHKFNGWADQFLGTPAVGLNDMSLTLSGKVAGGKWALAYHDFSSDDEADTGIDDLGSEVDVLYARPFGKNYSAGVKYAAYSAGDDAAGKVDTDKLWVWVGAKF